MASAKDQPEIGVSKSPSAKSGLINANRDWAVSLINRHFAQANGEGIKPSVVLADFSCSYQKIRVERGAVASQVQPRLKTWPLQKRMEDAWKKTLGPLLDRTMIGRLPWSEVAKSAEPILRSGICGIEGSHERGSREHPLLVLCSEGD